MPDRFSLAVRRHIQERPQDVLLRSMFSPVMKEDQVSVAEAQATAIVQPYLTQNAPQNEKSRDKYMGVLADKGEFDFLKNKIKETGRQR